jgi:hypothetical protein
LVTRKTQCVVIPILDDLFVENDEIFFLQSINANQTETIPQSVTITITNDDSNEVITVSRVYLNYCCYILMLSVAVFKFFESSYTSSEDIPAITICLELVEGLLATNVTVELKQGTNDIMATSKIILLTFV